MKNSEQPAFPIKGYEGLYVINCIGEVFSLDRKIQYPSGRIEIRKGRKMKPILNKRNGYVYIRLTDANGIQKGFRLHRLVASTFLENPLMMPEVNHKDYNKLNNVVSNLEWCDRFYQNQHSALKPNRKWQKHRLGKVGKDNPASKRVAVYSMSDDFIGEFESGCLAAKATKSNQTKVSSCCLGKRKSHNNLKFIFV